MKRMVVMAASALFLATGCATMFNQETQNLTFNSTPDSADIEVNGTVLGRTPWTGPVKRGSEQAVLISKDGYEPKQIQLKGEISGWVVANALWGLPGLLSTAVDVGNGAGYSYGQGAYHVTLASKGSATTAGHDTAPEGKLKRFVLMSYEDIRKEVVAGSGEKLEALMQLMGYSDRAAFIELCRQELADSPAADAFAERMIRSRQRVENAT